jgi:hypothetical protein
MTEDAAIAIDRQLCRACTPVPIPEWCSTGVRPIEPILPGELSVITVTSCIRLSKRPPRQWGLHWNCEMPPCGHTGVALKG